MPATDLSKTEPRKIRIFSLFMQPRAEEEHSGRDPTLSHVGPARSPPRRTTRIHSGWRRRRCGGRRSREDRKREPPHARTRRRKPRGGRRGRRTRRRKRVG